MNCREIKEQSSDYLDRRLTPPETALFREHLRSCPDCRGEVEELRKTVALVGSLDEIETRPDFLVQVNNKIDRGGLLRRCGRRLFEPWRIKIPLEAAALLAVTTLALYVYHRPPEFSQDGAILSQEKAMIAKQEPRERRPVQSFQAPASKPSPAPEAQVKKEISPPSPEAGQAPAERETRLSFRNNLEPAAEAPATPGSLAKSEKQPASPQGSAAIGGTAAGINSSRQVLEWTSADVDTSLRHVKAIVEELAGKIVSDHTSEDGPVLAIRLPRARETEFYKALIRETGSDSSQIAASEQRLSSLQQEPRGSDAVPMTRRNPGQVEKSSLKQDETVVIELRIRQKK